MGDVFVGRDAEIEAAVRALSERRPIIVTGPEGIGKSRLAAAAAATIAPRRSQRAVIRGRRELQRFDFAALLHLVRPGLRVASPSLALAEAVADLCRRELIVLIVDDAPDLDDATVSVLSALLDRSDAPRVVFTVRGDALPDWMIRLRRDHAPEMLRLGPLLRSDGERLAESIAGRPLAAAAARRAYTLAEGNPLALGELIRVALEAGALRGSAKLAFVAPLPVEGLRALVGHRISGLDATSRRAVDLLALGGALEPAVLRRLVPSSSIEALTERGLVEERNDHRRSGKRSTWSLSHPLLAEYALADMDPVHRSIIAVSLADALSSVDNPQLDHAVQQLVLLHEAGHDVSSADLLGMVNAMTNASTRALIKSAQAVDVDQELAIGESRRLLAQQLRDRYAERARIATAAHDHDPSFPHAIAVLRSLVSTNLDLDRASGLIDHWTEPERRALLGPDEDLDLCRVARLVFGYHLQNPQRAKHVLDASPWWNGSHTDRAKRQFEAAAIALNSGLARTALEILNDLPDSSDLDGLSEAMVVIEESVAVLSCGDPVRAEQLANRGIGIAVSSNAESSLVASALWVSSVSAAFDTRFDHAERSLGAAFRGCVDGDSVDGAGFFADGLALVARLRGRYRTAVRWARQSADLLALRDVGHRAHALGELVLSLCFLQETVSAREVLEELRPLHGSRPSTAHQLPVCELFVQAREGRPISRAHLQDVFDMLDPSGAPLSLHLVALAIGRSEVAAGWFTGAQPEISGRSHLLQLRLGRAMAAGDPVELRATASEAESLGCLGLRLLALEALSAIAPSSERPMMRRHLAAASRGCEGAGRNQTTLPAGLTRRELHLCRLAQQGLTDRAIAEVLAVSLRTVQSHLARSYAKLGIRGRPELRTIEFEPEE